MPVAAEFLEQGSTQQDGLGMQAGAGNGIQGNGTKTDATAGPAAPAVHQALIDSSDANIQGEQQNTSFGSSSMQLNNLSRSSMDSFTRDLTEALNAENYGYRNSYISSASSSMSDLCNSVNNSSDNSEALQAPRANNKSVRERGITGPCPSSSSSDSESEHMSEFVRNKNKKNIIKTLQGQADIITNWSVREEDTRTVLTLLGGNPYDQAIRMHNGNTGANQPGRMLDDKRLRNIKVDNRELERANSSSHGNSASASIASELEAISTSASGGTSASVSGVDEPNAESNEADKESQKVETESPSPDRKKSNRTYSCRRCLPTTHFLSKYYRRKHVIYEHGREYRVTTTDKLFKCPSCPKFFGQTRSRDDHAKVHVSML